MASMLVRMDMTNRMGRMSMTTLLGRMDMTSRIGTHMSSMTSIYWVEWI